MCAPWLVGRIAQKHGVGAGFWVTAASCGAIVALQACIRILARRKDRCQAQCQAPLSLF
jgi:hypothetical protein